MPKTILITGATDGIGLATAKTLASQGHMLLLHGRNGDKLASVVQEISKSRGKIDSFVADFSDLDNVEKMASAVAERHEKLDVLINNAGIFRTQVTRTADGLDIRFVVNTLAPYVLTKRLLLLMDFDGRVVNLSSAAQAPVDLEALAGTIQIDDMAAYAQSKLALTVWSRQMSFDIGKDGPAIIAVNPGSLLATKMVKDGFGVAGSDIQQGADILIRASLDESFSQASGQYFDNDSGQFAEPHPDALDAGKSDALIRSIEKVLAVRS